MYINTIDVNDAGTVTSYRAAPIIITVGGNYDSGWLTVEKWVVAVMNICDEKVEGTNISLNTMTVGPGGKTFKLYFGTVVDSAIGKSLAKIRVYFNAPVEGGGITGLVLLY